MQDSALDHETCRRAVRERDAGFDGKFFYAVKTTGVYCRPSCGARQPKSENVLFFTTRVSAEAAGFRACKRCKPDQEPLAERQAAIVANACRQIEAASNPPSLSKLANTAGVSEHHFHRLFKAATGVTPRNYATAIRTRKVQEALTSKADSITTTLYEAGYHSSGRFYKDSKGMLGMKPNEYKGGGRNATIQFAIGQSSLGSILVGRSDQGICAILLGDDPEALARDLQDRFPNAEITSADATFEDTVAKVVSFVEQPKQKFDLPLDIRGTAFQQRVWEVLRRIPAGKTMSYAEVAQAIGAPSATRAVAGACAANPIAFAIPCHRILRSDGNISGYRWGVERKRELLRREKLHPPLKERADVKSPLKGTE